VNHIWYRIHCDVKRHGTHQFRPPGLLCVHVRPVFEPEVAEKHCVSESEHIDTRLGLLSSEKVHLTAALEQRVVIAGEECALLLSGVNETTHEIRTVRVQLMDVLLRVCEGKLLKRDPQPVGGPPRNFSVHFTPHRPFSERFALRYEPLRVDANGRPVERDIVSILGHVIQKRHLLHIELLLEGSSKHVHVDLPIVICPPRSGVIITAGTWSAPSSQPTKLLASDA